MTPFVLIPGMNCTGEVFAPALPYLWGYGSVHIANHCLGEDADSMEAIARAILETAPPEFALAGFSMGGYIAFEILRAARDRVTKLALIDTMARPDNGVDIKRRRWSINAAQSGRYHEMLLSNMPEGEEALGQLRIRMAEEIGPAQYVVHQTATGNRRDALPDLGLIDVPTMVIVGETDRVTPPDAAREMADGIAGARYVEIADAGHFAPLEQPEAMGAALKEWAEM